MTQQQQQHNIKSTAAAYARYSTDLQTENSIDYQLAAIEKYAAENNISITHRFIDEGFSGTNTDRQGFQSLMAGAALGEFSKVIIYDISRGSRDVGDWFVFRKAMQSFNIEVISCQQQLGNFLDANSFLTELLSIGLAQHMVLDTRKKSMDGVLAAAKKGKFLGGRAPFGYDIVDQKYIINELEAQLVRLAFKMYAAGASYSDILQHFHKAGYKTRAGKDFSRHTLLHILKNERYAGVYIWNEFICHVMRKDVVKRPNPNVVKIEGAIPEIIDRDTFETVQRILSSHKTKGGRNKAAIPYLLSGLIRCEKCGATFHGYRSKNGRGDYRYYVCGTKYKNGIEKKCDRPSIRCEVLDGFAVKVLKKYLSTTNFDALAVEIARRYNESTAVNVEAEKKEIKKIDEQIQNGVNAILSGFDNEELRATMEKLKERKLQLQEVIAKAASSGKRINPEKLAAHLRASVENIDIDKLIDNAEYKQLRQLMKKHIAGIVAHADGSFTVCIGYPVDELLNGSPLGASGGFSAAIVPPGSGAGLTEREHIKTTPPEILDAVVNVADNDNSGNTLLAISKNFVILSTYHMAA